MNVSVELNQATINILEETANKKGISVPDMVRIIINEWAIRNELLKAANVKPF